MPRLLRAKSKIQNRVSKRSEVGEENEVLFDNQKSKIFILI